MFDLSPISELHNNEVMGMLAMEMVVDLLNWLQRGCWLAGWADDDGFSWATLRVPDKPLATVPPPSSFSWEAGIE